MTHSVRRHLRLEIDDYDREIRRFIPGYEEMLSAAAAAVAAVRPAHVLDLGAGTGALSEAILRHDEVGTVELLDVDPEMLDRARQRLSAYGDRVRFTLRSYDEPFPACDAVAASLALHHIPDLETKKALYARAHDALSAGGVFVNADANMPAEERARDRLYRVWADHQIGAGITESEAFRNFAAWAEEDTYLPLQDEIDALGDAGFEAGAVWRRGPMAVVVARR